jgi:hypothetical protein
MIRVTKKSVVEGTPARIIGWLLLLAIPMAFFSYGIVVAMAALGTLRSMVPLVAFCLPLLGCPLIAVVVGLFCAKERELVHPGRIDCPPGH